MRVIWSRDYARNGKRGGYSTGVYWNVFTRCERVKYLAFQLRGIGQLQFLWGA